MTPDLTNNDDTDPEGWLEEVHRQVFAFEDAWEKDPNKFPAANLQEVVGAAKALIIAMNSARVAAKGAE
jgi:hypothetical protein